MRLAPLLALLAAALLASGSWSASRAEAQTAGAEGAALGNAGADTLQPRITAPGLALPASFTGTLPAASGPVAWHLDLWPDQVFHLTQSFAEGPASDIGRWHADPARNAIVLGGGREAPIFLEIRGNGDVRLMDRTGRPIDSDLPYTLARGPLEPTAASLPMRGAFRYAADAADFRECLTGRSYPVEFEGDYRALERSYLDTRTEPFEPILAVLEGTLEMRPSMEGPDRIHLIVDRFDRLTPEETCPSQRTTPDLTDTFWRLLRIGDTDVAPVAGTREPYLLLRTGADPAFNATVGCNMMRGGYQLSGASLGFGNAAMTLMACPPPLDAQERALAGALGQTAGWRVDGTTLELLDPAGAVLLRAEAAYLR